MTRSGNITSSGYTLIGGGLPRKLAFEEKKAYAVFHPGWKIKIVRVGVNQYDVYAMKMTIRGSIGKQQKRKLKTQKYGQQYAGKRMR